MRENAEPIIQFVNQLLMEAIQKKASDVHIEPGAQTCRIRMRIDGLLQNVTNIDNTIAMQIISRCKIMAHLNIAEQRLPQDGNLQHHYPNVDIRLNITPTLYGEKLVLRIIYSDNHRLTLRHLGLSTTQETILMNYLFEPSGLILVTGPTGSGKSSTLYAALNTLNHTEKNILTIEDPIEVKIQGINQSNINAAIGLDFSTLLRASLRQDPDVIMIGEIRDRETAHIAIQAAFTGHLVLATLHAQSAFAAYARMIAFGIPWHDLTQSILLIINQRLIRLLCESCKTLVPSSLHWYQANSCADCNHGYAQRIGIFELLPITIRLRQMLLDCPSLVVLKQQLFRIVRETLPQNAMQKIQAGLTTFNEVERVLGKIAFEESKC